MKVNDYRWSIDDRGTWVSFLLDNDGDKLKEFNKDKGMNLSLEEIKRKRSLDANAMAWVLIGKLAKKIHVSDVELYREFVRDINESQIVPIREDLLDEWDRIFCSGHIGRMTIDLGECRNIRGYHSVKCLLASSDYDTATMSRFIDDVINECRLNGIDVISEKEKALLLEEWK